MPGDLLGDAEDFAARLTTLLNGTVTTDAVVAVFTLEADTDAVIVAPRSGESLAEAGYVPLSLVPDAHTRATSPLWLRASYRVSLDDEAEHLAIQSSVFGLCVNRATGFCPLRIEYDRHKTNKPASHLQIPGDSAGLAYASGILGRELRRLQQLHLPTGGRRFRPSLEDLIEFLAQEDLLPSVQPDWQTALADGRGDWEVRQARATVRRAPEHAAEQLRSMGWTVVEPIER